MALAGRVPRNGSSRIVRVRSHSDCRTWSPGFFARNLSSRNAPPYTIGVVAHLWVVLIVAYVVPVVLEDDFTPLLPEPLKVCVAVQTAFTAELDFLVLIGGAARLFLVWM